MDNKNRTLLTTVSLTSRVSVHYHTFVTSPATSKDTADSYSRRINEVYSINIVPPPPPPPLKRFEIRWPAPTPPREPRKLLNPPEDEIDTKWFIIKQRPSYLPCLLLLFLLHLHPFAHQDPSGLLNQSSSSIQKYFSNLLPFPVVVLLLH